MTSEPKIVPSMPPSSNIQTQRPTSSSLTFVVTQQTYTDIFERILEDCSEPGWDGYDAIPILPHTVRIARAVNSHLLTYSRKLHPHIAPGGNGTIAFEFNAKYGAIREIYVEVRPDSRVRAYWIANDGNMTRLPATDQVNAINQLAPLFRKFSEEGRAVD